MAKPLDTDLHILHEVNPCVTLVHYTKYDIHPSNSLPDIKQNPWDAKYRSLTYKYFQLSIFVSHWSLNSQEDIKQNHWPKTYRSFTYKHFMRSIFVPNWSIITSMTFFHRIVFQDISKVTGPWNIGHWPIYILWGQSLCHTDPLYQV